jgi:hypothetical protein
MRRHPRVLYDMKVRVLPTYESTVQYSISRGGAYHRPIRWPPGNVLLHRVRSKKVRHFVQVFIQVYLLKRFVPRDLNCDGEETPL